jgi:acetyl-CoA carboxylase biotin carboxylase subunit
MHIPGGPGLRFDTLLYPGYVVPPFYDSLLGKLIAWDDNRPQALNRMARALREIHIGGVPTTVPLLLELAGAPDVLAGAVHTGWLEDWLLSKKLGDS